MKVIDLLQRIANGEEIPEYINYTHRVFGKDTMFVCKENIINKLDIGAIELNDEVEIIEEDKKIEEINMFDYFTGYDYGRTDKKLLKDLEHNFETLNSKINEIIDYINKEK